MNGLCLILDGLHQGFLGAYGNTWIETPHFDRLATGSLVLDQALIDTPDLVSLYRSFLRGGHYLSPESRRAAPLPAQLAEQGVRTILLTDDPLVAAQPASFSEVLELDPPPDDKPAAGAAEETHLAGCFTAIIRQWEQRSRSSDPFFLWCHLAGLARCWDAPQAFREQYRDEEDPPPYAQAKPPAGPIAPDADPDELVAILAAYAGQIALLDLCLGALLETLDETGPIDNCFLLLAAARGYPLGEHGQVGLQTPHLHSPLVQVPAIIRRPDPPLLGARSQALSQSADIRQAVLEAYRFGEVAAAEQQADPFEWPGRRDYVLLGGPEGHRGLRTPAWYLYEAAGQAQLYVKPDDRWEANDVASRCRQVIEPLQEALAAAWSAATAGEPPVAIDPLLVHAAPAGE